MTTSVQAILTDIEGTTSSIRFVKDVLFPYAAKTIPDYLRANQDQAQVKAIIKSVAAESNRDATDLPAIVAVLLQWIAEDRKTTSLKTLQGMVWEQGYRNGVYKAHVYRDAFEQLVKWHQHGLPIYIYSSGSVQAQKLFFAYSEFGDLTYLFNDYFDTSSGGKKEAASYQKIAGEVGLDSNAILFLSDIIEELDAAKSIGMRTACLVRPEDTTLVSQDQNLFRHPMVKTFAEVFLE